MDNARVHAAGDCIAKIQRLKMTRLPQPAYSPDLNPCDFWLFRFAKQVIQDKNFDNAD
jgi:transposase